MDLVEITGFKWLKSKLLENVVYFSKTKKLIINIGIRRKGVNY